MKYFCDSNQLPDQPPSVSDSNESNIIPFPRQPQPEKPTFDKQAIIDSLKNPYYLFDFAEWSDLSVNDPDLFEKRRKEVIEEMINRCEERNINRIRGIQWRIEQERKLSSSSMDSCLRVYNMMWDHFIGDDGLVECLKPFQYNPQLSISKKWE